MRGVRENQLKKINMKKLFFVLQLMQLMVYSDLLAQNVGIGTTTPQSQLHIGDNSINELIIGRNKSAGGFTALYMGTSALSNGYSYLQSVSSAGSQYGHLILNPFNGNVGIATINPQFKLDVRGGSINTDAVYCMGSLPILASPGTGNLFTGIGAGDATTGGEYNSATGNFALYSNTTGNGNTANGFAALFFNSSASKNTGSGYQALYSNTFGFENTGTGYEALYSNTIGTSNTANGYRALRSNTTGENNTAVGIDALLDNTTGINNTAIGYRAMYSNVTGSYNTAIGHVAFLSSVALTNATVIGAGATVNASNKIRLGNGSVTVIEGSVPYSFPSDGRFKTNITETVKGLDFILKLRPVVYNFEAKKLDAFLSGKPSSDAKFASLNYSDAENTRQSGFIAQEVEQAAKQSGYDFNGVIVPKNEKETYGLAYSQFVVPLVKAMQEQQQIIEALKKRVEILEKQKQ